MWDACASKRGFVCGREAISIECAAGQGEGKRWNLPYGWVRKTKAEMEGRSEGRRKGGDSAAHVNSLNAPCWPRGCWQHSFVDSFPLSSSFPCLLQSVSTPVAYSFCYVPWSVSSSSRMTLWIWSLPCHTVQSADAYAQCHRVSELNLCALCNPPHGVQGEG